MTPQQPPDNDLDPIDDSFEAEDFEAEDFESADLDDGFDGDDDNLESDDGGGKLDAEDDEDSDDDDDVPLPADDDDDDEDLHPSDVEADLEEILRDRIAAGDDDDDDDEEATATESRATSSVAPPRSDEWTCNQCFLIVSVTQFGSRSNPECPSGEEPCESIVRVLDG